MYVHMLSFEISWFPQFDLICRFKTLLSHELRWQMIYFWFFQVLDPNPFPGLAISPIHGVVPVGGHAELKVQLTPSAILKFDTKIQVAIKGGRTLELRMGGNVEPPTVDIDVVRTDEIFITRNVKIKDFTEMNYSFLIASKYNFCM